MSRPRMCRNVLFQSFGKPCVRTSAPHASQLRYVSLNSRQRRDNFWIPAVSLKAQDGSLDATQLLTRAGYLRQAYSGIYHMLPLGLRVQQKLEGLIDKHMTSIDASKVSLSSISSQALWERSGRLGHGSEFFKFADRKDAQWLLAPTHEEEITTLVANLVQSPGQLPIRLYQISRKYRDEKRPRGGLLRGREFIMKDLYTFDVSQFQAHTTYDEVRQAYRNFLAELRLPYIEARADSGNMGGSLSHEYHFPSHAGEDDVISCTSCDYARNEEWVVDCPHSAKNLPPPEEFRRPRQEVYTDQFVTETIIDKSRTNLVKAFAPRKLSEGEVVRMNTYAIKAATGRFAELDTGVEQPEKLFTNRETNAATLKTVYYLFDPSISEQDINAQLYTDADWLAKNKFFARIVRPTPDCSKDFSLLKQVNGDNCPQCEHGKLKVDKAIEIGHTFHLGTRYSSKLDLTVKTANSEAIPVEMGCHGIGVSRLIAAVAASLSDKIGLNWPRAIAPFEAVVVVDGNDAEKSQIAAQIYDALSAKSTESVDVLLDDRKNVSAGYKLKDADLIGYPVIVIIGKTWQNTQQVEIQCRRLDIKENVVLEAVSARVNELLQQL